MQILFGLHVSENDDVTVIDRLALIAVLVSRLHNEADLLAAVLVELDQVARLVNLRTVFEPSSQNLLS